MTKSSNQAGDRVDQIKEYFRRIDAGDFPAELFAEGFQFYFPKYGVGHGLHEFMELAGGLQGRVRSMSHHMDEMLFVEEGRHVVVEGTTQGTGVDGTEWHGGHTPGGRFCSVFAFSADSLIERMHIYLDPDYTSRDQAAFLWPNRAQSKW